MIMPVEDVAYAACKRPTQKAHPGVQPDNGSKSVKTNLADRLPSLAKARTQTTMAMTPAKVQKIAKVCTCQFCALSDKTGVAQYLHLTMATTCFQEQKQDCREL